MRRRTTTKQLLEAVTNNLLQIEKAEIHYKSSNRIDTLKNEDFLESLEFLNESNIFSDFVDWHYEKDLSEKGEYVLDSGRMNPYAENVVTAYLRVNDGVTKEELEKMLLFEEE